MPVWSGTSVHDIFAIFTLTVSLSLDFLPTDPALPPVSPIPSSSPTSTNGNKAACCVPSISRPLSWRRRRWRPRSSAINKNHSNTATPAPPRASGKQAKHCGSATSGAPAAPPPPPPPPSARLPCWLLHDCYTRKFCVNREAERAAFAPIRLASFLPSSVII